MVALRHDDFDDADHDLVFLAGAHLLAEAKDLVFHHHDGDAWAPAQEHDTAAMAREARELLERMATAVTEARRDLADAERRARLRAIRRQRTP